MLGDVTNYNFRYLEFHYSSFNLKTTESCSLHEKIGTYVFLCCKSTDTDLRTLNVLNEIFLMLLNDIWLPSYQHHFPGEKPENQQS